MALSLTRSTALAHWPEPEVKWMPVRQEFVKHALPDVKQTMLDRLQGQASRVPPGASVAVAVGSRGIKNLPTVVGSLIGWLKQQGADPFIVPAMGSHGGGTAAGRGEILAELGISAQTMGVPVRTECEPLNVGTVSGVPVFVPQLALDADLVIPVARVKPHTDFRGAIESGGCKMLTVGLGGPESASAMHSQGSTRLGTLIREAVPIVLRAVRMPFALLVVEDGFDDTGIIELVEPDALEDREIQLLKTAREWMPALPVSELDILVVERMGKDISGNGMDPNITGRFTNPNVTGDINIARLAVLDLTDHTKGNATGIGAADLVTQQLAERIDWNATYTNHVASNALVGARLPFVALDEAEAFAVARKTLGETLAGRLRLILIRDTLALADLVVSEAVLDEVGSRVQAVGPPRPIRFQGGSAVRPLEWHAASK